MNGEQPAEEEATWLSIVLGVFVFVFVVTIGGCFVAVCMFRQSMSITEMSAKPAEDEFEEVRARFAGQPPLLEIVDGRPPLRGDRATSRPHPAPLKTMHVLAWDDDDEKLVTIRAAVLAAAAEVRTDSAQLVRAGLGRSRRELPRRRPRAHGPGLLLDLSEGTRRARVIIWVE